MPSASFFLIPQPYNSSKCLQDTLFGASSLVSCQRSGTKRCCFGGISVCRARSPSCCLWQGEMLLLLLWISARAV